MLGILVGEIEVDKSAASRRAAAAGISPRIIVADPPVEDGHLLAGRDWPRALDAPSAVGKNGYVRVAAVVAEPAAGTLVSGMMTNRCSDSSVSFVSAAATASGSLASTLRCLGAYATTSSPGAKGRLANTPRPAIRLCRNSTGDRLNIGLIGRPLLMPCRPSRLSLARGCG